MQVKEIELIYLLTVKWFQVLYLSYLLDLGWQICGLYPYPYFLYYRIFGGILSVPKHCTVIHSYRWLCSRCWVDCLEFGTSWSFIVHFGVHMYFSCLTNGLLHWISLYLLFIVELELAEIRPSKVFRCSWISDQSFGSTWISFLTRALYLLS